jgi:hypothetical protein
MDGWDRRASHKRAVERGIQRAVAERRLAALTQWRAAASRRLDLSKSKAACLLCVSKSAGAQGQKEKAAEAASALC